MIQWLLRKAGYDLVPYQPLYCPTQAGAFLRLAKRVPLLGGVIDIGASNGVWSERLMRHFPGAEYLLIEGNPYHKESLAEFCRCHPNVRFSLAVAGEEPGNIFFDPSDPLGGIASTVPRSGMVELPCTTVDLEVEKAQLRSPYLIKFDTHGYESPILKGAQRTLPGTEVIVMECYNFTIAPECERFWEMCAHLAGIGFRPIDVFDVSYRPHDLSLWQMDIVFVRSGRPEFDYLQYR